MVYTPPLGMHVLSKGHGLSRTALAHSHCIVKLLDPSDTVTEGLFMTSQSTKTA